MPATNVQIVYTVTAVALVLPTVLQAKMAAVPLPTGPTGDITQVTGAVLATDVTTISGQDVTRTINFTLGAEFNTEFPPGSDQASPFRELYTSILANALSTKVVAAAPVVT